MAKQTTTFDFAALAIDPAEQESRYAQVYSALRDAILSGRINPGTRLPSTRELANALALSRNTVLSAYDQLVAEGYLVSRVGDGTYVSPSLPDELLHVHTMPTVGTAAAPLPVLNFSQRHRTITQTPMGGSTDEHARAPFAPVFLHSMPFPTQSGHDWWHGGGGLRHRNYSPTVMPPAIGPCARQLPITWGQPAVSTARLIRC